MLATLKSRRTRINITYQGKDISKDLDPYLLSFSFTDNSGKNSDDLTISLEDREGLWLSDWKPSKSDTISASIIKEDYPDTITLPCGTFTVDQIDYSYPPAVITIKAVSASVKKSIAKEKHTRFWENTSLNAIASDIASKNGLSLFMQSSADGTFERIDQTEQTDLEFLMNLCHDFGQECKIQESQLVIYDLEAFENRSPVTSISIYDKRLLNFRFSSKSAKVYKKAKVTYHDVIKDEDYEGEFEDDDEEGSERELVIHERVESQAQAQEVAKQRLIDANRKEITGSLSLTGDVRLVAGVTLTLEDFGMFSGKHFVNKATHKVDSSGYVVTLELGMPKSEKKSAKKSAGKVRKAKSVRKELYYEGDRHY